MMRADERASWVLAASEIAEAFGSPKTVAAEQRSAAVEGCRVRVRSEDSGIGATADVIGVSVDGMRVRVHTRERPRGAVLVEWAHETRWAVPRVFRTDVARERSPGLWDIELTPDFDAQRMNGSVTRRSTRA
jgi:hypothetical protein